MKLQIIKFDQDVLTVKLKSGVILEIDSSDYNSSRCESITTEIDSSDRESLGWGDVDTNTLYVGGVLHSNDCPNEENRINKLNLESEMLINKDKNVDKISELISLMDEELAEKEYFEKVKQEIQKKKTKEKTKRKNKGLGSQYGYNF